MFESQEQAAAGILGGKRGTLAVFIYIMLGVVGLPVFSGFGSGIGYVVGATGGYIVGFLFAAAVSGAMMKFIGYSFLPMFISMMAGNLICYAFGTAWYVAVYAGETSISAVLMMCVVPYIIPDLIKIFLAALLTARLKKYIAFNIYADLKKGDPVIKYGEEIGRMLIDAPKGTWIHNHNMGCERGTK